MHRMIFEDIKLKNFNKNVVFACPKQYHKAVENHPFIDEIVDCETLDKEIFHYNTTNACHRYESKIAPFSDKHRSDIWAEHCGINLKNHNMHICLKNEFLDYGIKLINKKPSVLFAPISSMKSKNLNDDQICKTVIGLKQRGYNVFGCHTYPIKSLLDMNIPVICGIDINQWMGIIAASDYVISVDTSVLHFAGGINKPTVGIFTWADGKVYCKYYENCIVVQKHRDDGNWECGPCYNWGMCPKSRNSEKPCLTELTSEMILNGFDMLLKKQKSRNSGLLLNEKIMIID